MGRKRRKPPVPSNNGDDTPEDKREHKLDKRDNKVEAKATKTSAKVDLINAKANKSLATAQKRKWLVFLIGIAIAAFYMLKSGVGSGILDAIKSKLGM